MKPQLTGRESRESLEDFGAQVALKGPSFRRSGRFRLFWLVGIKRKEKKGSTSKRTALCGMVTESSD